MSKYEDYLDEPIIVISRINNSILVQGKRYKVMSLYNHSNGIQYYVLQNLGHLFSKELFSIVGGQIEDEQE